MKKSSFYSFAALLLCVLVLISPEILNAPCSVRSSGRGFFLSRAQACTLFISYVKRYSYIRLIKVCMWTRLGRLLQIAQGDRPMIVALLLQAFCTGIFVGTLELEANTVFLEAFGADRVPFALMVSGLAGILIAAIYGYFSKQLKTRSFAYLNLVVVIGVRYIVCGWTSFFGAGLS